MTIHQFPRRRFQGNWTFRSHPRCTFLHSLHCNLRHRFRGTLHRTIPGRCPDTARLDLGNLPWAFPMTWPDVMMGGGMGMVVANFRALRTLPLCRCLDNLHYVRLGLLCNLHRRLRSLDSRTLPNLQCTPPYNPEIRTVPQPFRYMMPH